MISKVGDRLACQEYNCNICEHNFLYQELRESFSDDVPPFCPECGAPWNKSILEKR